MKNKQHDKIISALKKIRRTMAQDTNNPCDCILTPHMLGLKNKGKEDCEKAGNVFVEVPNSLNCNAPVACKFNHDCIRKFECQNSAGISVFTGKYDGHCVRTKGGNVTRAGYGAGPCCHGRKREKCTFVDEWQLCKDLKGVFHKDKDCKICEQRAFTGIVTEFPN
jgi:hypothetical protein